ncbi:MAG: isopentenyl-diphosphate Delta-isomerase, partial [Opitutales bacterium]
MSPISTIATSPEHVVLLDLDGNPIGTMDKRSVHTANTPLHSAFSIFLFDGKGNMLSQQRAHSKKTWPGIWSNACCGHPASGESHLDAAHRRLDQELGLTRIELMNALPNFRYRAELDGIVENEICPVFIGQCSIDPTPNPKEVAATEWIPWKTFADSCKGLTQTRFDSFSPWSHLEG